MYCDFSGYSDMALGSAHLLGYKLAINFRMPFLAANIAEFWKRWHISLSTWLRDYLFIPLGRQPGFALADLSQFADRHDARRLVARCGLELRSLGTSIGVLLVVHKAFADFCRNRD